MVHTLPFRLVDKNSGKNVIQVTWVLLLKAHRAVDSDTWLATVLWDFLGAIKKGLISRQGVAIEKGKLSFRIISMFLVISLAVLDFEVVAYLQVQALSKFYVVLFLIEFVDCISPNKVDDVEGSVCIYPMILVQIPMAMRKKYDSAMRKRYHYFSIMQYTELRSSSRQVFI
ncbi:cellulose synthase-like protein [Medicago truncatula]|uniref:Cellulose synthase-like protein n=1 Tax=Medicago truncatula TaxID=3880 RepID=A0A072UND2_MEDTR|nr:cellulose synthase-like protein [Medicago truncatula]